MALNSLDNPLERLATLPNAMNWRGSWSPTEQYYLNDVVVSPVNLASYILNGKTALLNGGDPTTNGDWIELSATATGVLQVNAGVGLVNTNLPNQTIVDLENTGIITIAAGNTGIGILNGSGPPYPLNTVISNNGVLSLAPVAGPAGAGIGLSANTGAIQIANNGILGITAGTGLASTGGQNPTLSLAVSPIVVSNFQVSFPLGGLAFPPAGSNFFSISSAGATFLNSSLASGVLDPNGSWYFNFCGFTLWAAAPPAAGATLTIEFQDGSTGGSYIVPSSEGGEIAAFGTGVAGPITIQFPNLFIPVAALRAAGILALDKIVITNNTSVAFHSAGNQATHFATYYPNGAQ